MEDSLILKENDETQETEKEVIICEDESLMKYLVEVTEILLESIWKSSQIIQPRLCPLNEYLSHIIQQSKISLYTLKCAIIYFVRISRQLQDKRWETKIRLFCGRRMFLGSVIIASKYLYDRTYSNSMWARLLGLDIKEVNNIQMDFLEALNYDLYISKELDCIWSQMLENFISYLKVKDEESSKDEQRSKYECNDIKNDILASPISSPAMSLRMSSYSLHGLYQNFPNSPISPATSVKSMNTSRADEHIKSLKLKIMENQEMETSKEFQVHMASKEAKRLEEYRPFVKVLLQVIFMYSKNNQLPVGEKRVIELPRLATSPEYLFESSRRLNNNNLLIYQNKNAFHQLKHCLKSSKNISKTKRIQLNRYYFDKMFPNRHINYRYSMPSGYNSDHFARNTITFHLCEPPLNYDREEIDNKYDSEDQEKCLQEESLKANINLMNSSNNSEYNSSDWDSMSDDSFTLIGSSENGSIDDDNNEDYTPFCDNEPFFNPLPNYELVEKNNGHLKNSITMITPYQDNEMYISSKTLLPSQTTTCNLTSSNLKPLHHPKIVYPNNS